jgi:hypothetical protein
MGNVYWGDIPANTTQAAGTVMLHKSGVGWSAKDRSIIHISCGVPSPVAGRGNWIFRAKQPMKIIRISSCVKAATSVSFNIEVHATPTTSGTNALTADQVAITGGSNDTSIASPNVAEGDWLYIDLSAVSGSPAVLSVTITCQMSA